ncbi:hypothetical protein GCM10010358_76920 [Streptomyces minutiscleroticus]|uniref:Uncharacterized protein n=1 Tax=Streptomyces minutiscleroticus TaxID=68238 RepID=A0A918P1C7_9ACTN|nr:hypothetical protein GCM10010358_76920 [Streptomyces minutiscleroticus]
MTGPVRGGTVRLSPRRRLEGPDGWLRPIGTGAGAGSPVRGGGRSGHGAAPIVMARLDQVDDGVLRPVLSEFPQVLVNRAVTVHGLYADHVRSRLTAVEGG